MKNLLLVTLISICSTQVFATNASLVGLSLNEQGQLFRSCGFTEDGFTRDDVTCYRGDVNQVCGLIEKAQKKQDAAYAEGEHGTFKINSCVVSPDFGGRRAVVLKYTRVTDYGNEDESLGISKCAAEVSCLVK